ncbi:MAG: hypothetical protein ACI857_002509 [Arenicella sp.]|jgi:hypothetical protein
MNFFKHTITFVILLIGVNATAQRGSAKFGMQYKPIIPNSIIGFYEQEFNNGVFESTVKQKFGNSFSMLINVGLSDRLALETGIGFTQRNFNLDYAVPDSGYTATGDVRVVSYEIPLNLMVFIRLSDEVYMNTSLGPAMTFFPSDVQTFIPIDANERFQQEGAYRSKIQGALNANVGFEYRTKKSGTFYLGGSYHLPFTPIMTFAMSYEYSTNANILAIDNIRGSYLTVDLRYYFNENKDK